MSEKTNPLIIALDVDSTSQALELVEKIGPTVNFYKVGMELYAVAGMDFVVQLGSFRKNVFLDLKLYDIPATVKRATRRISQTGSVDFLTVHGSRPIMEAAAEGRGGTPTKLLGVTVLTSFDQEDLADLGFPVPASDLVRLRVRKAVESGMDGVVCSALEVPLVREVAGPDLIIVVPGVRSPGAATADQKRVASPKQAVESGANYLVIGREVTRASDPAAASREILAAIGALPQRVEHRSLERESSRH